MSVHRFSGRRGRLAAAVLALSLLTLAQGGCGSGGAGEGSRPASTTIRAATTSTIALPGPNDHRSVALNDEQRRAAAHAALTDPRIVALLAGLEPRAASVLPWSGDGTMATLFGSWMEIEWEKPVELEADWPVAEDADDGTVRLFTVHYRATEVKSMTVNVTFNPLRVVGFDVLDGNVVPASVEMPRRTGTMTIR